MVANQSCLEMKAGGEYISLAISQLALVNVTSV